MEFFEMGGSFYIAVANYRKEVSSAFVYVYDSPILKWNGTAFGEFQAITTTGAVDWEHFQIANEHYLAVASYFEPERQYHQTSLVYKWNSRCFV